MSSNNASDNAITADSTVDAVIAKSPSALTVLNQHNIDTCCGGRASLGEAAAQAHIIPELLIGALKAAQKNDTPPPVKSCNCGCR